MRLLRPLIGATLCALVSVSFLGAVRPADAMTSASNFTDITAELFPTRSAGIPLRNPSSFGLDPSGELYIFDLTAGRVFKIIP